MFRTVANKLLMVLYFVIGALILEALTFAVLELGFMPEFFAYNFFLIMVVAITVFVIPSYVAQYVIYTILLFVQAAMLYVNYSLTRVYGDLFSIEMIRLIGEAGAAMTSSFVYISVILEIVLVYALIVTMGALTLKYCKKDKNNVKQHFSIFSLIIMISVQMFSVGFSLQTRERVNAQTSIGDSEYALTDKFLMNTSILKTSSYRRFGTYGYYANMIFNSIRNDGNEIEKATLDYFNSGSIYGTEGNSSDVFGVDEGNNVIVIMMESLEWFGFGDGTYDPTFENLIYSDDQLNSKTFTPNLTKLIYGEDYLTDLNNDVTNDSLLAKNFFAKSKTNMSEGQGIIGNYPIAQSLLDVVDNGTDDTLTLGYAMPNVLRNLGYTTSYVHSHDISFYSRGKTHKYLGFDNVVGKDSILDTYGNPIYTDDELDFDNWAAEGEFVQNAINHIVPQDRTKPFYTFFLNVSSHGAYTPEDNENDGDALKYYYYVKYGDDDCELDANGNYRLKVAENLATKTLWYQNVLAHHATIAEDLVYYQCGVKGLDDAVGIIVNKLKEYNIYDETTMLLYSDHYAYYDNLSHIYKGLSTTNNNVQELNTIPMIISSPGIKEYNATNANKFLINDRFTSAYDVVPTLFDLLGVKFNENLYLGQSIFKPAKYIFTENNVTKDMMVYYSNTGGLFGDNIYTFDLKKYVTPLNYSDETIELFNAECKRLLIKINFISFLNRYNLYHKLTNI